MGKYVPYGDKPAEKAAVLLTRIAKLLFVDDCNCILCGKELEDKKRSGLCHDCLAKLPLNDGEICRKCGRVLLNEADYCNTCQNNDRHFSIARSACVYEDGAVTLVRGLKFGGKRYFAKYLANLMTDKYLDEGFDCDCVIAVPLSAKRKRIRGYNQADLLAREISSALRLDYMNGAVVKIKDNERQAKLGHIAREKNVKGAYKVADKEAVKGRRVLLVDDVLTTGATASEVAGILLKAKAKSVSVLTFASTRYKVPSETGGEDDYEDKMV